MTEERFVIMCSSNPRDEHVLRDSKIMPNAITWESRDAAEVEVARIERTFPEAAANLRYRVTVRNREHG